MHIKHILIFYIGILTCLLLSNCQDETPSVRDTKSFGVNVRKTSNLGSGGLNEARQFYINNSTLALKSRGADKSNSYSKYYPFLRKEPSWIFYICNQKDSMQVVEVDLTDCISQDYILKENWEAYKKYKQHKYLRSYTRYIYIHYLSSGRERAFYMTIIPTIDCVRNYSTRIPRNSYLHRNKYLSGYILYHSLDGNFINGWEYKDGKITGKVVSPELSINISEKKPLLLGKLNSSYTVELKVESQSRIAARSSEFGEYDSNDDTYDGGWFDELVVTPDPGNGSNNDDDWNDGSDWDGDGIWDDWQAPETDGDSDDDDSPVVVPDDDGGGGSGGVSGGVDEIPEYIELPKYNNMSKSFQIVADLESSAVYELIGGLVWENHKSNPEGFANACALRLSYAFNWCGEDCKIPYIVGETGSGDANGDNVKEWYFYKVSDMANYLNETYGNYKEISKESIIGKQGIIGFSDCNFSDASGHLDIWNGEKCLDSDYSTNCETIYFWEFK